MIFAPDILRDQVAIVTGGGTGIGRGIALELARAGAAVVVAGRRPEPLEQVAAEISALGRQSFGMPTDVRDWEQVTRLVASAVSRFGRLDILVNNAGGQFGASFETLSQKGWKAVIDTNLTGVFNCTRAAAEYLVPQGHGKVVNIIAGFSRRAAPFVSHSGAARAGVENLTRSLALEWAPHNIQVNCISPIVMTERFAATMEGVSGAADAFINDVPAGRCASLEEVGWLVVYLASRAGDFITGEHLALDGGYWLATAVGGRARRAASEQR